MHWLQKDGSGNISIQELKEVFQSSNLEDRNWENIIKEIDENGDGEVFNDFNLWILLLFYRSRLRNLRI